MEDVKDLEVYLGMSQEEGIFLFQRAPDDPHYPGVVFPERGSVCELVGAVLYPVNKSDQRVTFREHEVQLLQTFAPLYKKYLEESTI